MTHTPPARIRCQHPMLRRGAVRLRPTLAATFARRLHERFGRNSTHASPSDFVQRRAHWCRQVRPTNHRTWQLALTPHLHLRVSADARPATKPVAIAPIRYFHATTVVRTRLVERLRLRSERIDRLRYEQAATTAQGNRIEREAPSSMAGPAATRTELRTERVYRQAAPAAPTRLERADPHRATAQTETRSEPPRWREAPAIAAARSAPAELNIERIADRVVSAIDRRLLAQRERLGRV